MTEATADNLIQFVKNSISPAIDELRIVFYGGEPLLSRNLIVHISEKLKISTEDKAIKYGFSLVTNGTLLTPRVVEELKQLGMLGAKVTIDGPKTIHDAFRPYRGGTKSSFDSIVENLKEVSQMIGIQLGGNFTQANYTEFPKLLDYLLEVGLTPDRIPAIKFDPVTQEDANFGPKDFRDGCKTISEPWLISASVFLREEILKRGYKTQKIKPSPCIVELDNTIVVNYDGSLYKCPGFIGRNDYCIGNLVSGVEDYKKTHFLGNWQNEECLDCSYLPLCFGGCRYLQMINNGNMTGVDCRKTYLDAALEKFILQDIEYGSKHN